MRKPADVGIVLQSFTDAKNSGLENGGIIILQQQQASMQQQRKIEN